MISESFDKGNILLLAKLARLISERYKRDENVDIRPLATEIGLEIDSVMEKVGQICDTRRYNVGGHMFCTRLNVLPEYRKNGKLIIDKDHVDGLAEILNVESGDHPDR